MTLTVLDTDPAAMQVVLVTFSWGSSPTVTRYNSGPTDLTFNGNVFLSEPTLTFGFDNAKTGGTEDSPITVTMNMKRAPYTTLCLPYRHATVDVLIETASPEDETSRYEVFSGRVSKMRVTPNSDGLARATIKGLKSRLNATIGIPATSSCVHQFGNENLSRCGVTLADKRVTATVTAVGATGIINLIQVSGFSGDSSNIRWNRGYVQVNGLRITIRASYNDGAFFELKRQPPPYWVGQSIIFTPGCDKTLATCRYWLNELHFLAPGYAMPDRNPVFEE